MTVSLSDDVTARDFCYTPRHKKAVKVLIYQRPVLSEFYFSLPSRILISSFQLL